MVGSGFLTLGHLSNSICLPQYVVRGSTTTPVLPGDFGPKISDVLGFHYRNKPAQVVP